MSNSSTFDTCLEIVQNLCISTDPVYFQSLWMKADVWACWFPLAGPNRSWTRPPGCRRLQVPSLRLTACHAVWRGSSISLLSCPRPLTPCLWEFHCKWLTLHRLQHMSAHILPSAAAASETPNVLHSRLEAAPLNLNLTLLLVPDTRTGEANLLKWRWFQQRGVFTERRLPWLLPWLSGR